MDLIVKPKKYRRDKKVKKTKKQLKWHDEKFFRKLIDNSEKISQPYVYTFEFDKFLCVAFYISMSLLDIEDTIVHIKDRKMILHVEDVKKALNTKDSKIKVGFNYETGKGIFLEFIDGYIQLECLKTNEIDLKKAIKLVEYKLCKN